MTALFYFKKQIVEEIHVKNEMPFCQSESGSNGWGIRDTNKWVSSTHIKQHNGSGNVKHTIYVNNKNVPHI